MVRSRLAQSAVCARLDRSVRGQDGDQSGEMHTGIMLTNSATETKWWQMAAGACDALCFRRGRVRFLKAENGALTTGPSSPSHPHTLFYFGPDVPRFVRVFECFGLIFPAPYRNER